MISKKGLGLATEIIIMAIVISVILLFLGIGLLVVIHACIVGRSIRNNTATERGNNSSTETLTEDDIEKLPSYDFIAKSKGSSPVDCAVCLDNFKVGDKCRQLPICKHSFHAQCVDEWILKKPICPICRTTADSRRLVSGEESSRFSDDTQTTEFSSSNLSDSSIQISAGNSHRIEIRDNTLLSHEFTVSQSD
ncbi:RING/U-box superfamily protein [Euphorbia peplus]|nr:RING/U-box superfamily protein [Euphorbia peplus]